MKEEVAKPIENGISRQVENSTRAKKGSHSTLEKINEREGRQEK